VSICLPASIVPAAAPPPATKSPIAPKLFSVPLLVNQEYTDKLYRNLSRLLNDDLEKLQDINPNKENISSIENNCKSIAQKKDRYEAVCLNLIFLTGISILLPSFL
jgi:pyoverdine/dityrosine biosynthesis protein Dit1